MKDRKNYPRKRREGRKHVTGKGEEFIKETDKWADLIGPEYFSARVVEVQKKYIFVATEPIGGEIDTSDVWLATLARKFLQAMREERNFVVVGDLVLCKKDDNSQITGDSLPQCSIEYRSPRSSKISRLDPMLSEREHVLAANITQLVMVSSFVSPAIKWGLIDRFLVLAEEQNIKVCLVLNKKDLLEKAKDSFRSECEEMIKLYRSLGYRIFITQADKGIEPELVDVFKKELSLVAGHSGVGKSSLINLMDPELIQNVEDQEVLTKGRHTTTFASFIKLGTGGFVIDTPGIRSFSLKNFDDPIHLTWCYIEFRPYIGQCKFRECKHLDEPHCAIQKAVEHGSLSMWRYKSYIALLTGANSREGRVSVNWEE